MKPKVLYISLMGISEALGRGQVLEYLQDLAPSNDIYLHSFEKDTSEETINPLKKELANSAIHWTYLPYSNSAGIFSTLTQIYGALKLISRIIKKEKIDIIHARSMVPAVIGVLLKRKYSLKLLYDIRGFQMDEKAEVGRIKKGGLFYRFLKFIETSCYKQADAIVSLTEASRKVIGKYTNIDKFYFIPTCTNRQLFPILSIEKKRQIRKQLGFKEDDLIIIHTGAVSGWYDFDRELLLIKQLLNLAPNLRYLILNKGEHEKIHKMLSDHEIRPESVSLRSSSFQEVHQFLNISDASIFIIKPTFSKIASTPTKFGENLSCQLLSITNRGIGDMDMYLEQYKVGYLFDIEQIDHDVKSVAKDVLEMLQQRSEYNDFELLFKRYFDKQIGIEKYNEIYQTLSQRLTDDK